MKSEILTVSEAAQILKLSSDTVRAYERDKKLPAMRTPSGVRIFKRRDVEALARRRLEQGSGEVRREEPKLL